MIYLEPQHKEIIQKILSKYTYCFYAFGSRVKNTHTKFSDLDLCYKQNITLKDLAKLSTDFEESDLPFKIDLVNYQDCDDFLKQKIDQEAELFE